MPSQNQNIQRLVVILLIGNSGVIGVLGWLLGLGDPLFIGITINFILFSILIVLLAYIINKRIR